MIFNLFKKPPKLKEIIPKGFVDIHSHILPGIDDGAKNIKESLKLVSEMHDLGFLKIYGTPHSYPGVHNNTNASIYKSFNKLHNLTKKKYKISYASEYLIDKNLIKKAYEKTLLTINENYVLLEMSYIAPPLNLFEIIFELQINNYIPIIAHPERYRFFFKEFDQLKKLKKIGCKFQINLLSLTGYYGLDVLKMSNKLIKNKMINFAGSDIHNFSHINYFQKKIKTKYINEIEKILEANKVFM